MMTNDEIPKHRKKKRPRPYAIEYRVKPSHTLFGVPCFGTWHITGRYEKKKDMEQALKELQSRNQDLFEYREKEGDK